METGSSRWVNLAIDLIRYHGPRLPEDLHRLMPYQWHDHTTGHPGRWLGAQLRYSRRVRKDEAGHWAYIEEEG